MELYRFVLLALLHHRRIRQASKLWKQWKFSRSFSLKHSSLSLSLFERQLVLQLSLMNHTLAVC